jgi:hypothetical protein
LSTNESRGPLSKRGFIAAAAVVGIIVLAAIVASIARGSNSSATPPISTPSARSTTSTPGGEASVCGLPGFEATSSLKSAPTNKWQLVGTVAAPDDPNGAGPGTNKGGYLSCFSHTAKGALFAAVNIYAMSTDSRLAPQIAQLSLVPGLGRDAAIKKEESGQDSSSNDNLRVQVAGFKIDSYSATRATVDVVFQVATTGTLVSVPTMLQWSGGDWKGVTDDQGNSPLQSAQVQDLGGYTPWSGA